MPTKDPRVDDYIARAQPFARPILARIRKAVYAGCPEAVETIKWGMPAFAYRGPLANMAAFKAHCTLNFWKASLLKSVPTGKRGDAMGQFGRLRSEADLPSPTALVRIVAEAAGLNEAGVRKARKRAAPKPPPKAPPYLLAALEKDKKACAAWAAFPPSHQREYIDWITGAKTEETRARRLETAVGWIAEGKGRNWKYER